MCFDAKTSFSTCIFTVITSLLLIGDKRTKYALETKSKRQDSYFTIL